MAPNQQTEMNSKEAVNAVVAALLAGNKTTTTIGKAAGISPDRARHILAHIVARGHATKVVTSMIRQRAEYAPTETLKRIRGVM